MKDRHSVAAFALHARRARLAKGDPVALPITLASTFHLPGDPDGTAHEYGRYDSPTWDAVEATLSILEDAPVLAFPSGMAAISAVMFGLTQAGDRILIPADGYHATRALTDRFLKGFGVTCDSRPTTAFLGDSFEGYKLVFVETPANPRLDLCDLAAAAEAAHAAGALLVADNTTMTPLGQRPLDFGADIVVAADTKAPNGHSDALFGHVASRNSAAMDRIRSWRDYSGSIPGPFEAWQVQRGLETLEVRFDRMCNSAEVIAERLRAHPKVLSVAFPGLADSPTYELATRQMFRFGFLIALTLESAETAEAFINGCAMLQPATSFGGVHSAAERRARWGDTVAPGFVRLSVGCEPIEELWEALDTSLNVLK